MRGQESPGDRCACGQPLHYANPVARALVEALIRDLGSDIEVSVLDAAGRARTWRVPRHYIALHGLRARDLETLGFKEVFPGRPGPLRKVVDWFTDDRGLVWERLACGHLVRQKSDMYGATTAIRRRCWRCAAGE